MSLAAGDRVGSYEILAHIGAGGMADVYRARDHNLDRDVAVKVLPEHLAENPQALPRFEREAKAVVALNHPNISSIHDFGQARGISYSVTEERDPTLPALKRWPTSKPLHGDPRFESLVKRIGLH